MKVKKKWKKYVHQIALACLLICCVVQWMPENVFANDSSQLPDYDFKINSEGDSYHFELFKFDGSGRRVSFYYNNANDLVSCFTTAIISTVPISDSVTRYKYSIKTDGVFELDKKSDETKHSFTFTYNSTKYYITYYSMAVYYSPGDRSVYSGKLGAFYLSSQAFDSESESVALISDYIAGHVPYTCTLVSDGGEDGILSTDVGSVNNPIEDSEIGTIIISKYRFQGYYRDSEDENDCDFTFQWKNKTSTGFSLTKNKYAHTVIQCRVQSRCVVYKDLAHKQILKEFKNFGESAILYNSINVENNPYSIAYSYIKEKLPKTMKEIHNPLYVGYEYRFFFRVLCSDDLAVIPGNSGKWYAGGWRSVDLNASAKNEQNPNTSNGHFDDDDNWVTDKDDGNNSTDGGSTVSKDKDDARDDFANGDGKAGNSTSFDWNSFKGLINQCKEVPGLIKSVFSFLPDWVLVFVTVGFGIWIFVLIKRAIV